MINLTSSTHELRVVLLADPAGSPPLECHCVASWRETTGSTYEFGSSSEFTTGSITKGLVFGSSVASGIKVIDHISIWNPDTFGTTEVTVKLYDGTDEFILVKQRLLEAETLTYNDKKGWAVL